MEIDEGIDLNGDVDEDDDSGDESDVEATQREREALNERIRNQEKKAKVRPFCTQLTSRKRTKVMSSSRLSCSTLWYG
jgi:hypothetical protein